MAVKTAAGACPTGLRVRIDGGPSAVGERLYARLADRVRLGTQVVAVEQERDGVLVRAANGQVERGRSAVLAIPLPLQRGLRFDPPLSEHRLLALARASYGRVVKAAAAFAEPYRAEDEPPLSELTADGLVYEPDDSRRLIGFFAGSDAAGRARPPGPAVDWSRERFSRGSYVIFGPGDLLAWGRRLAEPQGRLHFAGAEASTLPSYLEGAVRAGERAADEVAATL